MKKKKTIKDDYPCIGPGSMKEDYKCADILRMGEIELSSEFMNDLLRLGCPGFTILWSWRYKSQMFKLIVRCPKFRVMEEWEMFPRYRLRYNMGDDGKVFLVDAIEQPEDIT